MSRLAPKKTLASDTIFQLRRRAAFGGLLLTATEYKAHSSEPLGMVGPSIAMNGSGRLEQVGSPQPIPSGPLPLAPPAARIPGAGGGWQGLRGCDPSTGVNHAAPAEAPGPPAAQVFDSKRPKVVYADITGGEANLSELQRDRLSYQPTLPSVLQGAQPAPNCSAGAVIAAAGAPACANPTGLVGTPCINRQAPPWARSAAPSHPAAPPQAPTSSATASAASASAMAIASCLSSPTSAPSPSTWSSLTRRPRPRPAATRPCASPASCRAARRPVSVGAGGREGAQQRRQPRQGTGVAGLGWVERGAVASSCRGTWQNVPVV